ncbi:MAG: hypothetical protein ABSA70_03855 [Terriglobia bacterium]
MPVTQRSTRRCEHEKADGLMCKANPVAGSGFCYFHHPAKSEERAAARRAGGLKRSRQAAVLPLDTPDRSLATEADVVALLGMTVNQVLRGQLDPKVANTVGYLSTVLLKALEQGGLADRIAALEAIVRNQRVDSQSHLDPESEDREFRFLTQEREEVHDESRQETRN